MKKIIGFLLLLCTLTLCLASCGTATLKSYEKNLGKNYKITAYDKDDIEDLAEKYSLDADDYGISAIIEAEHKNSGHDVIIIQCKSSKKAEELVYDLDLIVMLINLSPSFKVDAVADGKFVLVGSEDVIDDALNK